MSAGRVPPRNLQLIDRPACSSRASSSGSASAGQSTCQDFSNARTASMFDTDVRGAVDSSLGSCSIVLLVAFSIVLADPGLFVLKSEANNNKLKFPPGTPPLVLPKSTVRFASMGSDLIYVTRKSDGLSARILQSCGATGLVRRVVVLPGTFSMAEGRSRLAHYRGCGAFGACPWVSPTATVVSPLRGYLDWPP